MKYVRLSQRVPHHAFMWFLGRWKANERTLKDRKHLLQLTARSGSLENLQIAHAEACCSLTEDVFAHAAIGDNSKLAGWLDDNCCLHADYRAVVVAAASAGNAAMIRLALERSADPNSLRRAALAAAAAGGHDVLCAELLAGGSECSKEAVFKAAEGGHVRLTRALLDKLPTLDRATSDALLVRAAYGFNLQALKDLDDAVLHRSSSEDPDRIDLSEIAFGAFASRTPDWCEKLTWLQSKGYHFDATSSYSFQRVIDLGWEPLTKRGDALERLALLRRWGMLTARNCLRDAAAAGSLPVLRYLRSEDLLPDMSADADGHEVTELAAASGSVEVLRELLEAGWPIWPRAVRVAAHRGHRHVLQWLAELAAAPAAGWTTAAAAAFHSALREAAHGAELVTCAAESGEVETVLWLLEWERDCPVSEVTFKVAARVGSVSLLRALKARGCHMTSEAYMEAAFNGDMATLRCLRELGCPWGPDGSSVFTSAVWDVWSRRCCSLAVLRWLVEQGGCPVDWRQAKSMAGFRRDSQALEVREWIEVRARAGGVGMKL